MDVEEKLSFFDIMRIDLIRKQILSNIGSFTDIYNLAMTSRTMTYILQHDRIEKEMLNFHDHLYLEVFTPQNNNQGIIDIPEMKTIKFMKNKGLRQWTETAKQFKGEIFRDFNIIHYRLSNSIYRMRNSDRETFYRKIVDELDLNCLTRKNADYLRFYNEFERDQYVILHVLSLMRHDNIKTIEVPVKCLTCKSIKYRGLNNHILYGFPSLNKFSIYGLYTFDDYKELAGNSTILEMIFESLSQRDNPILFLKDVRDGDSRIIKYILKIIDLAKKYKIKVDCSIEFGLVYGFQPRKVVVGKRSKCNFSPISRNTFYAKTVLTNYVNFFNNIKYLEEFKNLEKLKLTVGPFDITRSLRRMENFDISMLGLGKLTKLREIVFDFKRFIDRSNHLNMEILCSNFEVICSLLPNTIERVKIINISSLTMALAKILNKYLPNIRILTIHSTIHSESDSILAFKNLEILISRNHYPTQIPDTLKFLAISHGFYDDDWFYNWYEDRILINYDRLKKYRYKFSKYLHDGNTKFIFFNDTHHWNEYKSLIQKFLP